MDISRNILNTANIQQLTTSLPSRTAANKGQVYLRYSTLEGKGIPAGSGISAARSKHWVLYQFGTTWVTL